MTMSKDRVRFFLGERYFRHQARRCANSSAMSRPTCQGILQDAFGIPPAISAGLMGKHPHGFHVICRPSQFARFIVLRCEADECINGVKDLSPELLDEREAARQLYYDVVADETGVDADCVAQVLMHANVPNKPIVPDGEIDVSRNPNRCEPSSKRRLIRAR